MNELIKELGSVKRKISNLQARIQDHGTELAKLVQRRSELEAMIKKGKSVEIPDRITAAILNEIVKAKGPVSPKEIFTNLMGQGFDFGNVKDPYVNVFAICARLAKVGKVASQTKNGRRVFYVK